MAVRHGAPAALAAPGPAAQSRHFGRGAGLVDEDQLAGLTAKLTSCVVAMEACCGAHHLGRLLAKQGHEIRLMSPEYVRPYAKAQKNDDRDAEAIAEAATRPTMRFVTLKEQDQLDMHTLHRVRSRLVAMRTMLVNQLRAILMERGLTFPQGRRKLEVGLNALLADPDAQVGERIRTLVTDIRAEWADLDNRIGALDREFIACARQDEAAARLVSIPGVGPITATALRAAIDDGSAFSQARDLPAWLGLVPRQHTTGGRPKLLGISKRGNAYLRTMFIHDARAALPTMARADNAIGCWLRGLLARAHRNVMVVALAAKLARIAWSTLRRGTSFTHQPALAAA